MKIIVVSAHPDDELIGVGGTLLKHIEKGDQIYWLIITNVFENQGFASSFVERRQREIAMVAERLEITRTFKLDFPTSTLSSSSLFQLIPKITDIFKQVEPEIVYCVNRSDAHSDHRITFDAVVACTKSFRNPALRRFLMYECISETEFAPALPERAFIPNYFVDITNQLPRKLELLTIYESEMGVHPFPRSQENIRALAMFRGASIGANFAEAFQLLKYIDK
jgi:N-acetylglucosamine malate deacetylase 1